MIAPFGWTCPYCGRDTTIVSSNISREEHLFAPDSYPKGTVGLSTEIIRCPSPECQKYTVSAMFSRFCRDVHPPASPPVYRILGPPILKCRLKPQSHAKVFPDYIPQGIKEDYEEACAIRDLSPKAAATLCRRCLQGMIRDFWGIEKRRLKDAITELEDRIETPLWDAIDAVRSIGNIGAHMEKDVDLIVDVEPDEAAALIGLIELLFKDWYIARHDRDEACKQIVQTADTKKAQQQGDAG